MADPDRDLINEQILYYRRRAAEYDETATPPGDPFAAHGQEIEEALHAFEPRGKVLELACGTGHWTRRLLAHAMELTAVDSSLEMLRLNREKVDHPRVRYVLADLFSWEPEAVYDVVFFANWLSHVPHSRFGEFWDLVAGCLAPGGRVFFVDEAKDAWRKEQALSEEFAGRAGSSLVRRTLRDGSKHRLIKVFWDPQELESVLHAAGWEVDVHCTGPFYWGQGVRRGAAAGT